MYDRNFLVFAGLKNYILRSRFNKFVWNSLDHENIKGYSFSSK